MNNIDYKLLEEQRDHLLSILWDDNQDNPVELDEEMGWGIINLLDFLLDQNYFQEKEKETNRIQNKSNEKLRSRN
jgi:hypothetical protein|tara:strand:- start:987 stop:1211 length:225 start_codon:yes stop_codon:yes gene_type:complete